MVHTPKPVTNTTISSSLAIEPIMVVVVVVFVFVAIAGFGDQRSAVLQTERQ